MLDIHAHILPGIDDGPETMEQAVRYAAAASREGIQTMIATPHSENGVYVNEPLQVISACSALERELAKHKIPLHIRPGCEVGLFPEIISRFDKGKLLTLNNLGKHILLELSARFIVDGIIHIIRQFAERGVTVILAHPERNATIMRDLSVLQRLHYEGALAQITAASVVGEFGRAVKKTTAKILDAELATFIASDIHPGRNYNMLKAYKAICALKSRSYASKLYFSQTEEVLYFSSPMVNNGKH